MRFYGKTVKDDVQAEVFKNQYHHNPSLGIFIETIQQRNITVPKNDV